MYAIRSYYAVAGIVNNIKRGLTKTFNSPRTTATTKAVWMLSTVIPGKKCDKTTIKTVVIINLIINFICLFFSYCFRPEI